MPLDAQTRLLRVLQQGEYTTVGGRTPIKTDVRIIAATNRDLRILIQQGLFREDLYFRLNVVPVRLPPLRERIEDIPDLARHFFARRKRGPAGQDHRHAGARAAEAATLARQRARTGKPDPPARRALAAGDHHGRGDRRRIGASPPCASGGADAPAAPTISVARSSVIWPRYFSGFAERRAAAGPLSPDAARKSKFR